MAFEASAPPLPGYEPLPGSEKGKPSCSESGGGDPLSFITPVPPDPLRGYVADPHHQSGYVINPHFPHQGNPQHSPFVPPSGEPVVFGFPVRPPPSSPPHWNTRLCGCCSDPAICLLGCCCPCILFGKIAEDLDEGATSCVAACTIWYLLQQFTACGWIYSHGYRNKLRSRYGLARRPGCDCIVHFCCWHCAFCQEYREIRIRRLKDEAAWERRSSMVPPSQQVMRF